MATVSVPTILRTHTDGQKSVEAKGSTAARHDIEPARPRRRARLTLLRPQNRRTRLTR